MIVHLQGFYHEFDVLMLQHALAYKTFQFCVSPMPSVDSSTDALDGPPLPLPSSLKSHGSESSGYHGRDYVGFFILPILCAPLFIQALIHAPCHSTSLTPTLLHPLCLQALNLMLLYFLSFLILAVPFLSPLTFKTFLCCHP